MKGCNCKSIVCSIILVFTYIICSGQDSRRVYFNDGWKFFKGNPESAHQVAFNDDNWRAVDLPHDWSVEGPFSQEWASGTGYLPGGIAWYRKVFTIPAASGKEIYLYFDGVYKNSEIWINEKYLGKRPNGYTSFYHNITPHLKSGKENVIAVKVDHTDFADSRWYTGSGINRNVYLIPVADVHVGVWGVSFGTKNVKKESADVTIDVSLKNSTSKSRQLTVKSEILSSDNKVVGTAETKTNVSSGRSAIQLGFKVRNPKLWSPESPALYTMRTSLVENGRLIDVVEEPVGFRAFSFDPAKGFFINGESVKLKGVCFHDDAGALGSAVPRAVWESRLKSLKDLGCNAIRMSHNPHQDYLYDLCDRMGFLVQDEAFDEWEMGKNKWIAGWNVGTPGKDGYNKDFAEWAEADLRDMILRNRNRASVIMWSIGNEIDYPNDPYTHEILNTGRNPQIYGKGYLPGHPPAKRLGEIAKKLVAVVKKYDTTRPVTAALAGVVMSNTTTYPDELDVVGYNYQEYRYVEDHEMYPTRVVYGSENGKSFDAWKAVAENAFISGQFLWTAFDFLGEARSWPVRSSGAGLIDMAGFPKPEYYHRKSLWTKEPVISIAVSEGSRKNEDGRYPYWNRHWNWNRGDSVNVRCYTNADKVELYLNGRLIGSKNRSDSPDQNMNWKILFEPGTLLAKGYVNGVATMESILETAGPATQLVAIANRKVVKVNPDDAAEIEIQIQDQSGKLVALATDTVTVVVDGPGKLIGIESGSLTSHEDYKSNKRQAVSGRLKAFIQAKSPGKIRIFVSGSNLKPYELSILSE